MAPLNTLLALALSLGTGLGLACPTPSERQARAAVWQPAVNATWQIILDKTLDITASLSPNVEIFDIDLFVNTEDGTSKAIIDALHSKNKKVICYFSAGSYEPYRPDSGKFTDADKGAVMDGWPDEQWLNLRSSNVANIMKARIQLAAKMGCDAVDPDNVDAYGNDGGGLGMTKQDSIDFIKKVLAPEAAANGMAIGLKNAGDIIGDVLSTVQFSVNEECSALKECALYTKFITAGKPVFHIEYPDGAGGTKPVNTDLWCKKDRAGTDISKFSSVIKTLDLDGWVELCNGQIATTPTKADEGN